MNIVPHLLDNPSWATIASFSANEMTEFVMFVVLSIGFIAAVGYGIYAGLRRKDR